MSDNGETSQTATSSGPTQTTAEVTDLTCVRQCSELVSQYKLSQSGKADTILKLRDVLLDSPAVKNGRNLNEALEVFIRMLDSIDSSKGKAAERGQHFKGAHQEEDAQREDRGTSKFEEAEGGKKQPRDDSESKDINQPSFKRAKTIDISKYPWAQR